MSILKRPVGLFHAQTGILAAPSYYVLVNWFEGAITRPDPGVTCCSIALSAYLPMCSHGAVPE
jgi:hypothetical protein